MSWISGTSASQQGAEKSLMAVDALAKLANRFAQKPDFRQLVKTFLLMLAGQFATPSSFSLLRRPGIRGREGVFTATGKFASKKLLQTLLLTPALGRYFLENSAPTLVSEMYMPEECRSYKPILEDCEVRVICPLLYNDGLLGVIGMGSKISGKSLEAEERNLLGTLIGNVTPMIVSSYHFHEIENLGIWYLDILDNVKQGVFVFDDEGMLKKVNRAGRTILVRHLPTHDDKVTLEGNPLERVFPESVFPDWSRRFLKAASVNERHSLQDLAADCGDHELLYEAYLTRISGDSGFAAGLIITLDDVSERKRAEEELKKSEERFRRQFEEALDTIIIADAKTGIIIDCNLAASELVGRAKTELVGMHQTILHPPDDINGEFSRTFREHLGQKEGQALESKIITKGGEIREVAIKANLLDIEGEKVLHGVFRDVTELKRAEKQERELREKLETAQRMESLGILAGGVAHDLNNMLGPLVGYSELLLLKLPADSPLRKQIQRMGSSARGAADIVQDLLTLARRGRSEMVSVDMNEIVENYLDSPSFMNLRNMQSEVAVSLHLDRQVGRILGSPPQMSKAVMNLVINAFDAMPDGGRLTVTTTQRYLESLLSGYKKIEHQEYVLLQVRDMGMGIDPKDLSRIFEPYYSKKKMGRSGSGLGLSIVYGVVKDHGGYYDILSEKGEGTEFILYFPVTSAGADKDTDIDENMGGTESVLVVDDVEDQRELAKDLLCSLGYKVQTAASSHDAVEHMRYGCADIIVLDMILENGPDGLDTYREIIKLHPGQKAVIVSGFSATERVAEMQRLGAGMYVKKPYTRKTIASAIRKVLAERPKIQRA